MIMVFILIICIIGILTLGFSLSYLSHVSKDFKHLSMQPCNGEKEELAKADKLICELEEKVKKKHMYYVNIH